MVPVLQNNKDCYPKYAIVIGDTGITWCVQIITVDRCSNIPGNMIHAPQAHDQQDVIPCIYDWFLVRTLYLAHQLYILYCVCWLHRLAGRRRHPSNAVLKVFYLIPHRVQLGSATWQMTWRSSTWTSWTPELLPRTALSGGSLQSTVLRSRSGARYTT